MSRLWYETPAKVWEEALPLGNGRLGAMIFGDPVNERIQVNEESMWYGGYVDRINPDAASSLPAIRELIFAGKIPQAEQLMRYALSGTPESQHPYQTLGDIQLHFNHEGEISNYTRELSLDSAIYTQTYTVSEKRGDTVFTRECFLSHPADCMIMHLTKVGPAPISFDAILRRGRFFDGVSREGDDTITLYGNLGKGGIDFRMGLTATAEEGCVRVIGEHLIVENAQSVTLFFSATTTYRYEYTLPSLIDILKKAKAETYSKLLRDHIDDYQVFYNRVDFNIGDLTKCDALPTDVRIKNATTGVVDTGLAKLYFDYGRYLLIACSREGTLPATLQGLWNQDMTPPWDSKYTININTEMNYWPAEICNLSELHLPLFHLMEIMQQNGARVARQMYNCRGIVAHHNTDINGDCAPQDIWIPSTYWVMGFAWLSTHIWTHFEYTLDLDFLRKYYPIMKESAVFFLDFLVEYRGNLVTCPSVSPENVFILPDSTQGANIYGVTMDNQILRDLFTECIKASEILNNSDEDIAKMQEALGKLIPNRIAQNGTLMEWPKEFGEAEPGHRHVSHLYGLHPSSQITPDATPELARAAALTLKKRLSAGGGHTGWSRAWITCHYAKLWQSEKAYESLELLFIRSTYPNLFDKHPPFQIDGNFGITDAIAEMLMQSTFERIILLPALPSKWKTGHICGLKARRNITVDIYWKNGKLEYCLLSSKNDTEITVKYEKAAIPVKIAAFETVKLTVKFGKLSVQTEK